MKKLIISVGALLLMSSTSNTSYPSDQLCYAMLNLSQLKIEMWEDLKQGKLTEQQAENWSELLEETYVFIEDYYRHLPDGTDRKLVFSDEPWLPNTMPKMMLDVKRPGGHREEIPFDQEVMICDGDDVITKVDTMKNGYDNGFYYRCKGHDSRVFRKDLNHVQDAMHVKHALSYDIFDVFQHANYRAKPTESESCLHNIHMFNLFVTQLNTTDKLLYDSTLDAQQIAQEHTKLPDGTMVEADILSSDTYYAKEFITLMKMDETYQKNIVNIIKFQVIYEI